MAEYIEREKAIAICQSYYEHCLEMHDYCGDSVAYDIRTNIQGLPVADVVPVVRCCECKHSFFIKSCSKYECKKGCGALKYSNDYCSYGERRCKDDL